MRRKKFSKEFKLQVVQELQSGRAPVEVAREHDLKVDLVCRWRREYLQNPQLAFSGRGNPSREDTKTAQLERKIGQLYLENEFLKRVNSNLQARLADLKKTK
jgi:transposase